MLDIIVKISTIFVMIFIGFFACRLKVLKSESQEHLVSLILNITLPCMLINSICGNTLSEDSFKLTIETFIVSSLYFVLAIFAAALLVRLFRVKEENDVGVYKIIFTSINAGFMGLPVTMVIFGNEAVYYMALHNIVLNLVLYSFCVIQLSSGSGKAGKQLIAKALKKLASPCIIGALAGVVLLFAGIKIPAYIAGILEPVGDVTIPVAMMIVGIQLADGRAADCFLNKKLVLFSAVTMLVWPLIILAVLYFVPLPSIIKTVIVLGAALPPATTISAIAANEKRNYKLAADGIIVTTLMAIITIPIVAMLINAANL